MNDAQAKLIEQAQRMLGAKAIVTDPKEIEPWVSDWRGRVHGAAPAMLAPGSTDEVVDIVRLAAEHRVPLVPQGGNTGMAAGATPPADGSALLLSLRRMNRIRSISAENRLAVAEAGVVLATLHDAAHEVGMRFPLTLGARGSCTIGGLTSTNAGGTQVLKFGTMRALIAGVEAVLPDGSVHNGLSGLKKDNRGYSLDQLLIGAEGTLGIVTAVSIKLTPNPDQVATALVGLASLEDAITLYRRARRDCSDLMSAFEFMPPLAFTLAREAIPDLPIPMATDYPCYVLMEVSGSGLVDIGDLMQRFLEGVMEDGIVLDGAIASSQAQARNLWLIREGMNEGQAKRGVHMRSDVSVPLSKVPAFVAEAEKAIHDALPDCVCVSYGHVGDGNVHLNVLPSVELPHEQRLDRIYQSKTILNQVLDRFQGSLSAEHGIGRLKRADFDVRLPDTKRRLLTAIKNAIDPDMVMNPGCQLNFTGKS